MANERQITYMETQWVEVNDNVLTVGLNDDGVDALEGDVSNVDLPEENSEVEADEICGEIAAKDGVIDLYSPVKGVVLEVNSSVVENPSILVDDPHGEGWLLRIQAEDEDEIDRFLTDIEEAKAGEDDEDDDDDDAEDYEEEEE